MVVSTNDEEIAILARVEGAEVPFLRTVHADDQSPISTAVLSDLTQAEIHYGHAFETVTQLMPNCPLRGATQIKAAWNNFKNGAHQFQISTFEFGWMNPWWAPQMQDNGKPDWLFPEIKFLQTFGTSETGIVQTKSLSSSSTLLTINDPDVEWKIVAQELWVKSNTQISGYLNTNERAIDEGWFKTGDLVENGSDGYFKIIGRKKEIMNVGGEKVMPGEIEDYIMAIDQVIDCTAFSVPNGITGQAVGVRIVAAKNSDLKILKKYIRQFCMVGMERFKVPAKITFSSSLKYTDRFKKKR